MFLGRYEHTIDDKGRLIVPVHYRKKLGKSFIITKGLENCIAIYPQEKWQKLFEQYSSLSYTRKNVRTYQRLFFGSATDVTLDRQGRICIPIHLRKEAMLLKEVVINGVGDLAEIWAKEEWDRFKQEADAVYEDRAELLETIKE